MKYIVIASLALLSACTFGLESARSDAAEFEVQKAALEERAKNGSISWVSAITQQRELDKRFASKATTIYRIGLSGYWYGPSWKYDSNDDEYYAFCLTLAEKLDAKEIKYSEFDSVASQRYSNKFN